MNKKITDEKARELALTDWDAFCELLKPNLKLFYICEAKKMGKSNQQIAIHLNVDKDYVKYHSKKCEG